MPQPYVARSVAQTILPYERMDPDRPAPAPINDGGFWGNLADTYADGFWGSVKDTVEQTVIRNQTRVVGFDALDHIPAGYEEFAEDFMWAQSPEEVAAIAGNIDENRAIRGRLAQNSLGANLGYGLLAGVFDPVNLIAGPTLKGVGFLKGALKSGVAFGSINAGQELLRGQMNPLVTTEETVMNIGMGYAVAGLIGGGIGHFTRGAKVQGTVNLSPEARAKADASGNRLAEAMARSEGYALDEVIDFNGKGVRIVEGNTGKQDRAGNYVRAFFRPKEAVLAERARAAQAKAVDDALGPVIPEEAPATPRSPDEPETLVPPERGPAPDPEDVTIRTDDEVPPWAEGGEEAAVPFGAEGETRARAADDAEPEDTIFLDTAAILAEFETKPWTTPRYGGIAPLPADAFKTPQEWLNFVVLHELNHKTTKRLTSESVADYENRINVMAYDEMRAGRLPMVPAGGTIEKLLLSPLPTAQLARLTDDRATHDLALGIGGDNATLTLANQAGRATTPGGSVFQRAAQHLAQMMEVNRAWRSAYLTYLRGAAPESDMLLVAESAKAGLPWIGSAARAGKLSPIEFRAYIGRAIRDDQPFAMSGKPLTEAEMLIVREAAGRIRKVYRRMGQEAQALGMFDAQRRFQREIDWRTKANARDAERLKTTRGIARAAVIEDRMAVRLAEIEEFQGGLDDLNAMPIKAPFADDYMPRIYDVGKIRAKYDDFVKLLADKWGGDEGAIARARGVADNIINADGEDIVPGSGRPSALNSRVIDLTDRELADFLVHDIEAVTGLYLRKMGAAIEMTRKYGSTGLDEQIDAMRARLEDQGLSDRKITAAVWQIEAVRDKVLGRFHAKNPMSLDNRAVRALKNFGNLTLLGRGIYAQLMDVARTVAVEGYKPLFQAIGTMVDARIKGIGKIAYAREAGEALEMVNARWMQKLIENDSALMVTNQTALERGLANVQSTFFILNLMSPFTVIWKDLSSMMSAHMLLVEAKQVAAAVRAGKTIQTMSAKDQRVAQRLASFGIDLRGAQMLADMPAEKSDGGNLWLPNLEAWSGTDGDHARELFLAALNGTIRSNVITPGPLDRPAIMDGVFRWGDRRIEAPILSLPFQLLSHSLASTGKLGHSMLTGRDRSRKTTMLALMLGGYVSARLAAGDAWENMDTEDQVRAAFDKSGIGFWMGDVYRRTEDLLDTEGPWSRDVGAVAGPAPGIIAGVMEAFTNPELEDRQRASMIRRAVPMGALVWWDETLKEWTNIAADAGLVEIDPGEPDFDDEPAMAL